MSAPATTERATQLFTQALLYTISNEAVSGIIDRSGSQMLPLIILTALGAAAVAIHMLVATQDRQSRVAADATLSTRPGLMSAIMLLQHLISLIVDVSVQFASNGIGRLVLWGFIGSQSLSATVFGVGVGIILLWALRQASSI